jgi:tight adherence protein C
VSLAPPLAALAAGLGVAGCGALLPHRRTGAAPREGLAAAAVRLAAAAGRGARRRLGMRPPAGLAARIAAAGTPAGLGVREVTAAKIAAAAAGALAAAPLATIAPGRLGLALELAGPAAGFLAPDWWLRRRAAERARRVRRHLPALLDLLRVSVDAGLAPVAALAAVGARSTGPLAEAWRAVGREVALGVPMADALARVEEDLPLPEVTALGAALRRAHRHGAPLAETLGAAAGGSRRRPRRRAPRSSWSSRCCWCHRSCCWWRRRSPRRCSTAAACPACADGSHLRCIWFARRTKSSTDRGSAEAAHRKLRNSAPKRPSRNGSTAHAWANAPPP